MKLAFIKYRGQISIVLILCAFLIVWFNNAYDHPDPFFTYLGLFLIDIISCGGSGASIQEFKKPCKSKSATHSEEFQAVFFAVCGLTV